MNIQLMAKPALQGWASLFVGAIAFAASFSVAQTTSSDRPYSVVERGPYYNVLQRAVAVTNSVTGEISQQVESYTELSDGMNYLSNGVWSTAQDLIEITTTGAQAVHGQMTASFSSDITSVGAVSLSTAIEVFQSHPIGLFYADSVSGKLAQIAPVQSSVGTLYPPNVIVFSNIFAGLRADLMLVWAKNGYEQNLVLKQSPPTPESFGLSSRTTTLQFWTAMDNLPTPQQQRSITLNSGLVDHIFHFQDCWMPVGSAFASGTAPLPPQGQAAQVRPIDPSLPGTVQVAKSIESIDGSTVLVEEIRYTDLLPLLSTLPQASLGSKPTRVVELAQRGQFLAGGRTSAFAARPLLIASAPYRPKAVTLDYVTLNGSMSSFTFTNTTYWITNTFTIGPNTSTFSNNACIKFNTNAYLFVQGPVSFPSSGSPVIFTSVDDNTYGEKLPTSTANPGYAANPAVWFYYQGTSSTMQDAVVRWAQEGVEYTVESGGASQYLYSSVFQDCTTGVSMNMPNVTLYLSGDTYCNVVTPVSNNGGTENGSMTANCGVVTVAMVNDPHRDTTGLDTNKNSQSECSFAVLDSTNIVAAFMSTHFSEYGLGAGTGTPPFPGIPSSRIGSWATSRNGGTNFTDNGPLLPVSTITNGSIVITNGASDPTRGDAGDPDIVYDPAKGTYGTLYLILNSSRESATWLGPRLWISTDKGTNFTLINTNIPNNGVTGTDGPRIKLSSNGDLYATCFGLFANQATTWVAHSADGGTNWDGFHTFDTNYVAGGALLVQTPDGTIYAFWLKGNAEEPPKTNVIRYAWLSGTNWSYATNFVSLNSENNGAGGNPLRFNGDNTNDFFISNGAPQPAFANGRFYVAYADLPSPNSTTDHGDIFLAEAITNSNHWLGTPTVRKVNNDGTLTDQWDPAIAANPAGTELFIRYYSRQNDPVNNSKIMAYGAKAYITNGLSQATFECSPISPTSFLPVFAGTNASNSTWAFDPVWPQGCVCLDTNAVYASTNNSCDVFDCPLWPNSIVGFSTVSNANNFCADDYTWAASDSTYFYYAWCDRSRTDGTPPKTRSDADVKIAKIKQ